MAERSSSSPAHREIGHRRCAATLLGVCTGAKRTFLSVLHEPWIHHDHHALVAEACRFLRRDEGVQIVQTQTAQCYAACIDQEDFRSPSLVSMPLPWVCRWGVSFVAQKVDRPEARAAAMHPRRALHPR